MTRCDYDAVFYRVFCVTLLAIAFTFTVILTNVFIDIDGLLANKQNTPMNENKDIVQHEFTADAADTDESNYGESDNYRTKRSIETQSFLFHIKNPKVKNILANRLSTLLEELDAEQTTDVKPVEKKIDKDLPKDVELVDVAKLIDEKKKKVQEDDKMLHLAMHNILLQGIIGHMDLIDVYKQVNALIANFNELHGIKGTDELRLKPDQVRKVNDEEAKTLPKPIEEKFINEMVNCNELKDQINHSPTLKPIEELKKPIPFKAPPNVMIRTIINITSACNDKFKEKVTKNTKGNIKGIIELMYNGNIIKFTHPDEITQTPPQKPIPNIVEPQPINVQNVITETTTTKEQNYYKTVPKPYLDKFVEEYFKRFPHNTKDIISTEIKENFETKRLKREVRIKYNNNDNNSSEEKGNKKKNKTEEDELYVEIETHFDSKGMKGEKKKKLIRNLIEKIQKAIHSDGDGKMIARGKDKIKKLKPVPFKKRLQDPLAHKTNHILINKYSLPRSGIIHRQLNPISKTIPMQETSSYVDIGSKSGDEWKKQLTGPAFLAGSKSINSAEMSELNVDYSKILDVDGIPQRLQKPLNTEFSEETMKTNSYYDVGKMKFYIKDIDGSGFSVGFNQYVDEQPDAETMGLFTGIENIVKTYHQNYDPADATVSTTESNLNDEDKASDSSSPNNEHIIVRRSLNRKGDYHSNEYKIVFDHNYMPYKSYRDIFETQKSSKTNYELGSKKYNNNELPLMLDQNILNKNLKPAEIFSLANLFDRKKRTINVKKISNLKSKIKLNRYLNTKAMSTKRIFLNKRRNKRQINKIRIIARDLPELSRQSDENIFVVSDENVFANRAIVKDIETSEAEHEKQEEAEYIPYPNDDSSPSTYVTKIFEERSRHNPLMSKYPHIFMEEISRSREEYIPNNALLFGKLPGLDKYTPNNDRDKDDEHNNAAPSVPSVTELPKLHETHSPKANYKLTVKIVPKNSTGLNSGFKEIHTSINKRFNKNGLMYSSLVNVSEISNVVKLNKTKYGEHIGKDNVLAKKIKEQQDRMQFLLKQHAKHINEQLNRLNEEKTNVEYMLGSDNLTDIRYQDDEDLIPKPSKDQSSVPSEANEMKADNLREAQTTSTQKSNETPAVTTTLTTTPAPQPPSTPPPFTDKVKTNILNTIERNGNLTDLILKKIDKNTDILKEFLKKITEKITRVETSTPSPTPTTNPKPPVESKEEKVTKFDISSFPPDWKNKGGMQFNQKLVIRKNDSHISIPFIYTYQNPTLAHKNNAPIAGMVYHGHIQTNTIHPKDIPASTENEKVQLVQKIPDTNQTRFFIDELENDYKVIQVGDVKNNHSYDNMVNGNGTVS